jgi:phosphoethanolamine N-methyltransferase
MTSNGAIPPVGPLAVRFSQRSALRSEWIYGNGYQGPSSLALFEALVARQPVWPGMEVLEIGSGLGGDAFRLSTRHGVRVRGIDASPDMTRLCVERAAEQGLTGVEFQTGDVRTIDLGESSVDLVWTRDCFMYLSPPDKRLAWSRLRRALRPGGRVMVTDYCRGAGECSPAFEEMHRDSGFHLITQDDYAAVLESAGFTDVVAENRTGDLTASEIEERTRMIEERDGFLTRFTREEYDGLLRRWDTKISLSSNEELTWMVLTARA